MKFGVKRYGEGTLDFFEHLINKSDFIEIQAIRGEDYSFLDNLISEIQIIVHAEHLGFGINYMDNKKEKENTESLDFAKKIADRVNAKKIIIHLGEIENDNCSIKNGIDFVKNNFDDRLHLENTTREFSKFENFKAILEELKINFCFDINHAIINSIKFDREYYPEIKKFIELRPEHYHFCGIKLDTLRDHISLHKSDIDTKKVINILPKDAEITLELTTDKFEVEKDLDMIKDIATIYDSLGRES